MTPLPRSVTAPRASSVRRMISRRASLFIFRGSEIYSLLMALLVVSHRTLPRRSTGSQGVKQRTEIKERFD